MVERLTVLKTERDKYVKNAREFLLEMAERGYEKVVMLGFKDDSMEYTSSATDNVVEDLGAIFVGMVDKAVSMRRERKEEP